MGEHISAAQAAALLDYDPLTGEFRWRVSRGAAKAGAIAGSTRSTKKYRLIPVGGKKYMAHRLAFLIMEGEWPPSQVDHIDRDISNNRWANLRHATPSQNCINRLLKNATGLPRGVCRVGAKYMAQIWVGRTVYLGLHETPETAHAAYMDAAKTHFGDFASAA